MVNNGHVKKVNSESDGAGSEINICISGLSQIGEQIFISGKNFSNKGRIVMLYYYYYSEEEGMRSGRV